MARKHRYHHGALREALMEAALRLVDEKGLRGFSLREASREAGVAPSAPYRHFADRAALMTAIAEEAALALMELTEQALAEAPEAPLQQYRAMGVTYVKFAAEHPTRFLVMSDPEYADSSRSEVLKGIEEQQEGMIRAAISKAQEDRSVTVMNPELLQLTATALTYGLARMFADGHFARAGVSPQEAEQVADMVTNVLGHGILHMGVPGIDTEEG